MPLAGINVVDLTSWWAGPACSWLLAALGANVIHVESPDHIDGWRMFGGARGTEGAWWERGGGFFGVNPNKDSVLIRSTHPEGRMLLGELLRDADLFIENSVPKVIDRLGLRWEDLKDINRRLVMVRMPGYGLSGPWRDQPAFAQTIEQVTGLAWVTGPRDDQPRTMVGPCDLLAGVHAAVAALAGLNLRDRTGRGALIEAAMVEAGLAITAEQVATFSAYGLLLERDGNGSVWNVPQGVFRCQDEESWIAISIETDEQWLNLSELMGATDLAADPHLRTRAGRLAVQGELTARIAAWCVGQDNVELADRLCSAGVPAGELVDPCLIHQHPHFKYNGFIEMLKHAELGDQPVPGLPFRFTSVERWYSHRAPLLGEDNERIIRDQLGRTEAEFEALVDSGVVRWAPDGYDWPRPSRNREKAQ